MTQALPKEVPQTLRRWKHYPAYKDSGVEWLGEIPKDWEMLHLRRVIRSFVDYRGATPEKVPDGIPLITARNIKNGVIDFSLSQEYIREEDYASWMVRGFPEAGDVLVTTEAPLGESAQILEENIALAQRIILLKA
jgi:type I restriction enzyme S subunit